MNDLDALTQLIGRLKGRLRAQRVLEATSSMLLLSGAWLLVAALLVKLRHLDAEDYLLTGLGALLFPAIALLVTLLRPLRPMVAAQIADERLGLKDRIGSAYDFAARRQELEPYAAAQVEEASVRARELDPREAVPFRMPGRIWVFAFQLAALGLLLLLPFFPEPQAAEAAPPPPTVDGMEVDYDELDGFNAFLRDVHRDALDEELEEVAEAAEEFNRLLQDLADERLPYRDALERIASLEQKIAPERWAPEPEVEDYFKKVGRDLERSKLMNKTGKALKELDLREARDEVRQLAERSKTEPPNKRRLDELRRAVERAAKEKTPDFEKRRQDLEKQRRRLKQKQQKSGSSERQKRRLKRNKRELERLRRDIDRQRERQRQLERLSRDLQQLGEGLNLEASPELEQLLDQLGEDINRMAQDQSTEQQMRELRRRLEELRRLLQQLQRGGKGFKMRLGRLNKGARGKAGSGGKVLQLAPGGGKGGLSLLRRKGQGSGSKNKGQGQDQGGNKGQGIGTDHDPRTFGDQTKLKAQYTDVQVSPEQGEGPSRSEVIETAADQGFSARGYGKVHETYEDHAETLLDREEVPPGYRRYVRRYFESIRPR